jgi:DNA-nicking Smr family endonuclease
MSKKKDKVPDGPFSKLAELKKKIAAEEEAAKKPPPPGASRNAAPAANKARATVSQSYTIGRGTASPADDDLSFHRLMSGVVPLEDVKSRVGKTADAGPSSTAKRLAQGREAHVKEEEAAKEHLRELAFGGQRFEVTDDGKHVEGRRTDIPDDVVRKLRRGQLPIDARLDLHGMRAEEARNATHAFLRDKRSRGERCVLVIHGRGEHSSGPAVLRGEMAAWLSQTAASEHVAAFTTAIEADGGEGAVYVLLRR